MRSLFLLFLFPLAVAGETLWTGPEGSEAVRAGLAIQSEVRRLGKVATLAVCYSSGAVGNAELLASGPAALALAPCDILYDAVEGGGSSAKAAQDLRVVALLYPEPIYFLARGDRGISTVADLRWKHIAVPTESRVGFLAWLILDAQGLRHDEAYFQQLPIADGIKSFESGESDAIVLRGTDHMGAVVGAGGVILPVDPAVVAKLEKVHPYLHCSNSADTPVAEVDVALVARADVPDAVARDLAETLFTSVAQLTADFPPFAAISPKATSERSPIPLHHGTLSYLEEVHAIPYPVQVYVGVYAYSISELDFAKGTWLFDGYIWFRWRGRLFDDQGGPFDFALVNGAIESIDSGSRVIHREGWNRQSRRFTARLRGNFLLRDYPFDRQRLDLVVEHRWQGDDRLVFVPDDGAATSGTLANSFLARSVAIADWRIRDVRHRVEAKKYETDFGSIAKDEWQGASSRYTFTVEVERSIVPYALKLLLPLVVAVAMGFIVFWIDVRHFDAKSCLGILAILNCIALHVVHSDHLPQVGYMVKADWFFVLSYLLLSLTLVEVVWESNLHLSGRTDAARRLMRVSRWAFPLAFAAPIVAIFLTA